MRQSHGKRVLLLGLLVGLGFGLGARAQEDEGEREIAEQREARERLVQMIPVPEDRDALAGRFVVAGETREVSRGEIYDTLALITRLDGAVQNVPNEDDAWTRIMLVSLADALDVRVPDSAIDQRLHRASPEIFDGVVERWQLSGVSREAGEAYEIDRLRIDRLRDFFLTNERVTTRDAFDQFKVNRLLYRIDYATFEGAKHSRAMREAGASDEEIESYWNSNPGIQARFRLPVRISGTVVYLDPADYGAEEAAALSKEGAVSRERALAYFQANRERLIAAIPPSERQFLTIPEGTPLEDVKSPFELVRGTIEKKLALEHLIDEAYMDVVKSGFDADLEKIAAAHHLKTIDFVDLDRQNALSQLQKLGVAAFTQLFGTSGRAISPTVLVFEDVRYFFRIDDKKESTIPSFAEVKDQVRDLYFELAGAEAAQEEVRAIYDLLGARVAEAIAPERERLEQEARDQAEARIAELGITDPAAQNRERARSLSRVRIDLDRVEREARPALLAAILEDKGIELKSSPLFEFDVIRPDRSRIADPEESRMAFFRTCYQLRAMKPGEVAPTPLEDHLAHEFHIARLAEVRDPELATMGPVDLMQAKAQLKQVTEARFPRQFEYEGLAERFGLERF